VHATPPTSRLRTYSYFRHRRTHEARPDGEGGSFSEEELDEADENEFGTLEDEMSPPPSDQSYMTNGITNSAMTNMTAASMHMPAAGMGASHGMAPPTMMTNQHLLQQQM
jgi:hypothetical protein